MVEIEEISLYGIFYNGSKSIQISEEHFLNLRELQENLSPIPIDWPKLVSLGFEHHLPSTCSKSFYDVTIYLKPLLLDRWLVYLEGGYKIGVVQYIHQVQRLWYTLFDEHLFLPKRKRLEGQERIVQFHPGNFSIKIPSIKKFVARRKSNSKPEVFEIFSYKFNAFHFKETATHSEITRMLASIHRNWDDVHIID